MRSSSKLSFACVAKPSSSKLLMIGLSILGLMLLGASGCNNPKPNPTSETAGTPSTNPSENLSESLELSASSGAENLPATNNTSDVAPLPPVKNLDGFRASQASPATQTLPAEMQNRTFAQVEPITSSNPAELLAHLQKVDRAIGDLLIAGTNNLVEGPAYLENGRRLSQIKLGVGEQLSSSAAATAEQRKTGLQTQLVALSHLSGLEDVQSAKRLETLARSLTQSGDPDLAHQSRVVLLGFELQSLENGIETTPNNLLAAIEGLFQRPEDRTFPGFMMLMKADDVLTRMGFSEAADRVRQIAVDEFQNSPDRDLRDNAWLIAVEGSSALENYSIAMGSFGRPNFDAQAFFDAARGLYADFPLPVTLEKIAASLIDAEYSGNLELSQQLADFVSSNLKSHPSSISTQQAQEIVDDHQRRVNLVGKPLDIPDLLGFDGNPLNWDDYRGKTVLVDFWATDCVFCLQEMPKVREAYEQLSEKGFDVIAINMNANPEAVRNEIINGNYPWRNFYFASQPSFESQYAKQIGLRALPFILLIAADGKVTRIHLRGENILYAAREALGLENSLIP